MPASIVMPVSARLSLGLHFTHVPSDGTPPVVTFARPDPSVAVRPPYEASRDLHGESSTQRDDGDVGPDAPYAKLHGLMLAESDLPASVGGQVLRLGSELPVWSRKQKLVGDQRIERVDICRELRRAELRFERHDLEILRSHQNGSHASDAHV
jgi:hypothetical protein